MWRSAGIWKLAVMPQFQQQSRNMATLKDISVRLKSVTNIQKITKSMKMVAAAKYAKAERDLKPARPYGEGAKSFFENIAVDEEKAAGEPKNKHLLVLLTSDRGLCGAVHTSIAKVAKNIIANKPADVDLKMILIGDKAKATMQRSHGEYVLMSGNEFGRLPPTFEDASTLAQAILSAEFDYDQCDILYNKFRTIVSYKTSSLPLPSLETIGNRGKLAVYDSLDADVLQCYTEFSLASLIYYGFKECATSEQSSRMTAMDGAAKNAGEMIDRLTLEFNRTRQAVITRELIEIISGAAAV